MAEIQNDNYWKDRYQHLWKEASQKEEILRMILHEATGLSLIATGLGATTSDYISGSAASNNNEKGSPDFRIAGTNVFVEVTGPISSKARPEAGLWLRPDKLNYAYKYRNTAEEFFALFFPAADKWYVIHADQAFFNHVFAHKGRDDYHIITPTIRGSREKYVNISFRNPFVRDLQYLIDFLLQIGDQE